MKIKAHLTYILIMFYVTRLILLHKGGDVIKYQIQSPEGRIGLSIAEAISKRHGGRIGASESDGSFTVTVTLPTC